MARYVVLSFDDNETAEEFVKNGKDFLDKTYDNFWGGVTLVGLYAKPTLFCPHSGSGGCRGGNKRVQGWTRGLKYGWWVCAECKKPSSVGINHLAANVISNGVNLLENLHKRVIGQTVNMLDPDEPVASIHDEGWGVYSRG